MTPEENSPRFETAKRELDLFVKEAKIQSMRKKKMNVLSFLHSYE